MAFKDIVTLNYLWWGVSIGGKHYTGEVHYQDKKVELTKKLSRKESKEFAEREDKLWFRRETETNQFDTLEELERAAIKWCEENVQGDWLLQEYSYMNPERPIAAKGYYEHVFGILKELAAFWATVGNSQREGKLRDQIYGIYYKLVKENN